MLSLDPKQLRGELVELIEKQIKTLAKETCGQLTETELREYAERRKRIEDLYAAIHNVDSTA
jgi:hypothetical protein